MIEIEIDGIPLQAEQGSMIIEAADKAGLYIPRFCYHKKLSIAANCRMCLVEVEKAPKPLPACATPVTSGMKVYTSSAKAKDSQRSVMEFLLINHPLDCPICDQGGQCELQDLSLGFGKDYSRYEETKRAVDDDNLGPLISTEMTRCIHCTRCVRFGTEIAGQRELGLIGRGEHTQISTYIQHSMESELSGNIVDLCPVGALTSKPFRFTARAWELTQHNSIAAHDCLGSHVHIHTRNGVVMRVVPAECETINETWLSDRDRYSYTGLAVDRLEQPMIKVNNEWQTVDWAQALRFAAEKLTHVKEKFGAGQIASVISPSATVEEMYLLQKLMRGLGSNNIDHRLHQTDFSDQLQQPLYPKLEINIAELEEQDVVILLGSNIQREQPLAAHRLRKATLRGANIFSINAADYAVNFEQTAKLILSPNRLINSLAAVIKYLQQQGVGELSADMQQQLSSIEITSEIENFVAQLKSALSNPKRIILLGALAHNHPQAAVIRSLAQALAKMCDAKLGFLTEGANSAGAWLAGAVPHREAAGQAIQAKGLTATEIFAEKLKAYILFNVEPNLDCVNARQADTALSQAECVIACSPFKSDYLEKTAHVILPIAAFTETDGTFVNVEGQWQSFVSAVNPLGTARPGWKVLRVLANQLQLNNFEYVNVEQIREELQQLIANKPFTPSSTATAFALKNIEKNALTRIGEWTIYAGDNLVRRSQALQECATNPIAAAYINPTLAQEKNLQAGQVVTIKQADGSAQLPIKIVEWLPNNCVWVPAGRIETSQLGETFGAIEIHV